MMGMDIDKIMTQMRERLQCNGLDIQALREYLKDCPWHLHMFTELDSTNTFLKKIAQGGAPAGSVVVCDRQSAGRGRLGRTFLSPGGVGVYLSALIRPNCAPRSLMHLTCAVAVAMCDAVEKSVRFRPGIKWTNDLVYQGRKLSGILTELGISPQGLVDYAVIGVGLNCCQKASDFPEEIRNMAGSLAMISGTEVDRNRVTAAMIEALWRMDLSDKAAIMDRYRADCITLGSDVSLVKADGTVRYGHALDIDAEGALIVRLRDGSLETVNSGEVSVRGMYGYA